MRCADCLWWDRIAGSDLVGVCLQNLVCLDTEYKGSLFGPKSTECRNAVHLKTLYTFGCNRFEPSTRIAHIRDEGEKGVYVDAVSLGDIGRAHRHLGSLYERLREKVDADG